MLPCFKCVTEQTPHSGTSKLLKIDHPPFGNDPMNPDDVLLWPDGFWCFQEELSPAFLRDDTYRVIPSGSEEALKILSARPTVRLVQDEDMS